MNMPSPAGLRDRRRVNAPRTVLVNEAPLGDRLRAWRAHHGQSARDSLRRLLLTPLQTLMTWLLIAVALALPAALLVGIGNVERLGSDWDSGAQLSVFLKPLVKEQAIHQLQDSLQGRSAIESVTFVSPDQALAEFQQLSGMGEVLNMLDNNPLPPVLVVKLSGDQPEPAEAAALAAELRANTVVDDVRVDLAWVQRLNAIMQLVERVVLAIAALLGLGVLLAIGNTVRLAIENRRDEIIIVKLVGGTDGFVRRPFLYTGLWYGMGGGVLASLLVALGLWWLSAPLSRLIGLYGGAFEVTGLGSGGVLAVVVSAAALGWFGAALAVRRHLKDIEPR